jgi:hypothetical protein
MILHAHVILELTAPKEVSMIWDLNRSASFSSQDFSSFTRSRDRQSATNTPSYRCCPGSLFFLFSLQRPAALLYRYIALALHSPPWETRSACPLDVNPPDLFWISVASRVMVKVSSTYFSHLPLFSVSSTQYCAGGGSTIGVRRR